MRTRVLAVVAALVVALLAAPPSGAVVNGRGAVPNEFPFVASIQDADGNHFCGASVISNRWVVTAAHCLLDQKASEVFVVTGRTNLDDTRTGTRHKVVALHRHPGHEANPVFDVGVVQLATPTPVTPIALSSPADDDLEDHGDVVRVAGWGDVYPAGGLTATSRLRTTDLFVVGDEQCGLQGREAANTVCAEDFLEDSCYGDSGGPLWAKKAGTRVLVGIVSRGLLCAVPQLRGMYTEINAPAIRDFIREKTAI